MRIAQAIALGASLIVGVAGCKDYLSGPSLGGNNPNAVQKLKDATALYVGLEGAQQVEFTSQLSRFIGEYMQQTAGVARQQAGYDVYNVGPGDVDGVYSGFYAGLNEGGGGAADARLIQIFAAAGPDSLFIGIAKVWEAMIIGEAAAMWGATPYSQAFNPTSFPTPKYDDQITVFKEVETTLDSALLYLKCTTADVKKGSTNIGPTGPVTGAVSRNAEVIYAGRTPTQLKAVYSAVAHTLKARFYLDMALVDASNYGKALTEAQLGIASPADDWNWYSNAGTVPNEWFAFMGQRGDNAPGAALVNLMKARMLAGLDSTEDRFNFYFLDAAGSKTSCLRDTLGHINAALLQPDAGCTGWRPGANTALPHGGQNSSFNLFATYASFQQPAVTYTETQLIIAEAAFQTGNTGAAQTALDNARANEVYGSDVLDGLANCTPECAFAPQKSIPVSLKNIIEEKYIDLWTTPEVYNDYKRTCLPYLAAAPANPSSAVTRANIPGRFPYGLTSINADPNTPNVGPTALNANQPTACPTLTYTSTPAAW